MKKNSFFKKRNISFIYSYMCLNNKRDVEKFFNEKNFEWFDDFKKKEIKIYNKIDEKLKKRWNKEEVPVIEKAILLVAVYELLTLEKIQKKQSLELINKAVDFSKKYLDFQKFKYINAVLDSILKEE